MRGYNISIRVHPMVYRYIDNNYPLIKGVYDLTKSNYYLFITSLLSRKNITLPSRKSKRFDSFVPVRLMITEFDFYHYGFEMSEATQSVLSRLFVNQILHEACFEISMLHLLNGVPRRTAVRHYIDANLYEDDELKIDALLTYYKRKWIKKEAGLREYWSEVCPHVLDDKNKPKRLRITSKDYYW